MQRKSGHRFRVTVEALAPDATPTDRSIQFEIVNHDDILAIVERVQARDILPEEERAPFAVGLKMLGEVLLHNRRDPLFADLAAAFGDFMKKLKGGR